MPKLDCYIVKADSGANMIKQKQGTLKVRLKGEVREIPLNKGKYDRSKINKQIGDEEER
jgi:hypothetical protein